MMKKLAVTVFALSLAAIGCGSDSGSKPDAAGKTDGPPGAETQVIPDAPPKLDVIQPGLETGQPDKPAVEVNVPDAPAVDQAGIDAPAIDSSTPGLDGGIDAPAIDGGTVDAQKSEAGGAVDTVGVDSHPVG
jgi:hypothetical protein